jgi:hypothetical protein
LNDFTLKTYQLLLKALLKDGYSFQTFEEFLENPSERVVILRHDVDALPQNSLATAQREKDLGIRGSYYFRIVRQSNNPVFIKKIADLGHEIGYHYEDLALSKGNLEKAIAQFEINLAYFRNYYPVKTICMHGSPLSKYDNRQIWKEKNYRDYGIIGEPYFDIDFSKVFYLTDTGRRWDGEKVSVRDKVSSAYNFSFKTTQEIIQGINELPNQIMITVHPQRWTDKPLPWIKELVLQNMKNLVKKILIK